jgi:hypothetical protein
VRETDARLQDRRNPDARVASRTNGTTSTITPPRSIAPSPSRESLPELRGILLLDGAAVPNEVAVPLEKIYPLLRVEGQIFELVLQQKGEALALAKPWTIFVVA